MTQEISYTEGKWLERIEAKLDYIIQKIQEEPEEEPEELDIEDPVQTPRHK